MTILEVCVDSLQSAISAFEGGANRLELCSALDMGGLTPSIGFAAVVRENVSIPIHALIRPRGGDFIYTNNEVQIMINDIKALVPFVDGFVIGALLKDGSVDITSCQKCITAAFEKDIIFHRDVTANPLNTLQQLVCLRPKLKGILSSGGSKTAVEGVHILKQLIEKAQVSGIEIIAGGGVTPDNVDTLLEQTNDALSAVHGSFRGLLDDATVAAGEGAYVECGLAHAHVLTDLAQTMGSAQPNDWRVKVTLVERVRACGAAILARQHLH